MPRRLTLAAVFAALALPASADGETCTSNGGEWDSPGSWSDCTGTGVPDATDDVVIPSPLTASVTTADAVARSIDLDPGGTISVFNARTLTVGGGSSQFDGRVEVLDANSLIRLNGTSTWASGDWSIGGERDNTPENDPGGKIENAGSLTLGGAVLLSNPGNGQMANLVGGTVQTTGTPTVDVAFDNNGAVNVNAGSLTLARGGMSNGDYAVADGATLVLANTHAISMTGGITGAGTLRLSPGVVTLAPDAAYSPAETAFAGGQLGLGGAGVTGKITSVSPGGGRRGAGTLTVAPGASTLAGIFFAEGGTTTFAPGGTIAATGLLEVLDKDTVVRLNGTTTWSAGTWSIGGERFITNQPGGRVENAGVLNLTHDASATPGNAGAVANLAGGTLNATPPGTATFGVPLLNAGTLNASSGTLNAPVIQSAGTTTVTGTLGSIVANGGVVTGGGTITGLLDNAGGTVRPGSSPGTLSAGSFTQGAGGTLAVEVDGTSAFDILAVTGTANLGGTVAVDRGFDPAPSDVFSFLTAGAVNGTFATLTGGALPGGAAPRARLHADLGAARRRHPGTARSRHAHHRREPVAGPDPHLQSGDVDGQSGVRVRVAARRRADRGRGGADLRGAGRRRGPSAPLPGHGQQRRWQRDGDERAGERAARDHRPDADPVAHPDAEPDACADRDAGEAAAVGERGREAPRPRVAGEGRRRVRPAVGAPLRLAPQLRHPPAPAARRADRERAGAGQPQARARAAGQRALHRARRPARLPEGALHGPHPDPDDQRADARRPPALPHLRYPKVNA